MHNKWELPLNFSYKFIFQNEKLVSILGPSLILISTKSQNLKTTNYSVQLSMSIQIFIGRCSGVWMSPQPGEDKERLGDSGCRRVHPGAQLWATTPPKHHFRARRVGSATY